MSATTRRLPPPRHAQVHFPPMTGAEALVVIDILERAEKAIWRAHGDAIADYLGCVDPESPRMWGDPDATIVCDIPGGAEDF